MTSSTKQNNTRLRSDAVPAPSELLQELVVQATLDNIKTLCFQLGLNYESIPPGDHTKKAIIRELIAYMQRHGRYDDLIVAVQHYLPPTNKNIWDYVQGQMAAYAEKMIELYGYTRFLGKNEPIPLDDIFTDIYLLDEPTAWQRYSLEQLQQWQRERQEIPQKIRRHKGLKLVQERDKLFILGKPGAGKTTFLKYITLQALNGHLDRVPIFVPLRELVESGQSLVDFIQRQFEICNFPHAQSFVARLLKSGKGIILLDGLDEVNQADDQRAQLINALTHFTRQYNDNKFLITCRLAATDYTFAQFTYVEVADFTPEQVATFVGKWFRKDRRKRDMFLTELEKPDNERLWELARVPLLLILLCLNFEGTLSFPPSRAEIYKEAIENLLKKWDAERDIRRDMIYRQLSPGRKQQMLSQIAADTFEKEQIFMTQDDLACRLADYLSRIPPKTAATSIDNEAILKAIVAQHGMFSERARHIYSFAHLTFQEYFTAKYIVDNAGQGTICRLIEYHLTDDRWREVFLLTADLLPNADHFFEIFRARLDKMVLGDKKMMVLLNWVVQKAAEVPQTVMQPPVVRSFYLYLCLYFYLLAHTRDLDLTLDLARALYLDLACDRALYLDLDRARALSRARSRARDLDLALDLARALYLARDLDLALALYLDLDLDPNLFLDLVFYFIIIVSGFVAQLTAQGRRVGVDNKMGKQLAEITDHLTQFIQKAHEASVELGLSALAQALKDLSIPSELDDESVWHTFHKSLQRMARKYRRLEQDWGLTDDEFACLSDYLQAIKLLLDCLELAVVSDRDAIRQRLLLPPRQKAGILGKLFG